ncbi:4Fe-4S binding protein [Calditerrivibrio nitroreducens]|uniref:4Fe-4S ferredoxin iron-sulfur binding domain protein n=1 Tax=Calditerrivibrio nitroreducens (strain DSM 19672 / NBRC 101217 / Yu37-1) TaxID=768670 RepID=E4TG84_CALNY|nr:4Fe-4S binding protein [Calditerrivibrio nitroreducens]ADR19671.1 4Fe-4S ferredoxin iron-sulfur binding domain protein [Calditerrivibrio nitroreducens DSM 19672]
MRRYRLFSQITFFILFLIIFFTAMIDLGKFGEEFSLKGGIKYIFIIDPFITISTFIASHKFELIYSFSILFIVITFVLGRFFCGWICPFGTLHHFVSFISKKIGLYRKENSSQNFYKLKYYILFFILVGAIFGVNLSGYVDPLSIIVKGFGIFLLPVVSLIYKQQFLPDGVKDILFYYILGREEFYYSQAFLVGLFFLFLLGLNFYRQRFWCIYLCPLGAFYGLLSKHSLFKINRSDSCNNCGICNTHCTVSANPGLEVFKSSECMLLFDCIDKCPRGSLSFSISTKKNDIDISRRSVVISSVSAIAAVGLLKVSIVEPYRNQYLIRPPGATTEWDFLALCIRCGGCMKVCPENFLQPAFFEAGLMGLWTPIGNPMFGYCIYNCNLCGQVCPTGAISKLTLDDKKRFVIGTAFFDKDRCLPYAYNVNCMVCEEHCPTSPKAIYFEDHNILKDGREVIIKKPVVNPNLCIGCGICTYKCPVTDKPAIYITSIKKGGIMKFLK